MIRKPIGPTAHGAIDYGFATLNALAPTLLGLTGPARAACYGHAASLGLLNALTDHPLGLARLVALRRHGQVETLLLPGLLVIPWLTGALRDERARGFFLGYFAIAATNYLLSDYNADEPEAPEPLWQQLVDRATPDLG